MSAYPRPFSPADFPAIPPMVEPRGKEVATQLQAKAPVYARSALRIPRKPDAYITRLWLQDPDGAATSQSFQNKDPSENAPVDASSHFHFIPRHDKVEARWQVVNPDKIVRAKFEIWAFGIAANPIWSKEVNGGEAVNLINGDGVSAGSFPWSDITISGDNVKFPDSVPNVAFAPYQMRLTVESVNGMITAAWTYFDILVHSMELFWGSRAIMPAANIQDVLPIYRPLTQRDERDLVDELDHIGAIDPTRDVEIALRSTNAAYIHLQEWYMWRDMAYERYKARWGAGPRIPIVAKISLSDIDGNPQRNTAAKRALGPAKFLWDWHDKTEAQRRNDLAAADAQALTFVIAGLKYKENAATDPPACLNAHAERGGKRGSAQRVFPDANLAPFPFRVSPAGTRTWASVSEAATSGPYKGETGIVFQPSRMALDSYHIRVFLATGGHLATLDVGGTMQSLITAHPGLPTAETGMITILRRVDAKYIRKSNDTLSFDLNAISSAYSLGGIKVVWTSEFWTEAQYKQLMTAAITPDNTGELAGHARGGIYQKNAHGRRTGLNNWTSYDPMANQIPSVVKGQLPNYDQWYGCAAGQTRTSPSAAQFTLPGRDLVEEPFISAIVQAYIEKDRTVNLQKLRWNVFKAMHTGTADRLRVRFYYEVLSATERAALLPQIKQRYLNAGWQGWDVPRDQPTQWANANYNYRSAKLVYLADELHVRKVLADAFEGVTIFHYQHFFDTLNADGSVYARQCQIGGVAAISMIADLGLSGAFSVWDHPTNMQRQVLARQCCETLGTTPRGVDGHTGVGHGDCTFKDGNSTAVHEFGHFLHLPHARPTGGDKEAALHDKNDAKCIMNYDPHALRLCGGCLLRLRGWGFFKRGAIEGFSNTTPNSAGAAPPPCSNDEVERELAAFYTDWA